MSEPGSSTPGSRRRRPVPQSAPRPAADWGHDPAAPGDGPTPAPADPPAESPDQAQSPAQRPVQRRGGGTGRRRGAGTARNEDQVQAAVHRARFGVYEKRVTLLLRTDDHRALAVARLDDGVDTNRRIRAMIRLWQEDPRLRARIDNLARETD